MVSPAKISRTLLFPVTEMMASTTLVLPLRTHNVSFLTATSIAVGCALVTHAVYKRYEPAPGRFLVTFILLGIMPSISVPFIAPHFSSFTPGLLVSFSLFYATLLSSIILYRISPLHPLYKYPGPFLAKVSKFWNVWVMMTGKNHLVYKKLHAQYGPYVRIGPNELSITDVTAISSILGANGMPKGPSWEVRAGPNPEYRSLISMRTVHEHVGRRKRWNRAFSTNAVKEYEPIVIKRALQLVDELQRRSQPPPSKGDHQSASDSENAVDLAQWLSFFTTDFMGDMAFGGGFELMHDGQDKIGVWTNLEESTEVLSYLQHIPWLASLLPIIPGVGGKVARTDQFARELVTKRKKCGSMTKDLFHHLIDEDRLEEDRGGEPPADEEVVSDGVLAIIAGSDTTSTVLSGLFCFVLAEPKCYERLREEVDSVFPIAEGDPFDATRLAEMPYLNAVINEALRFQPPVPSTLQRAPEKGSGGHWIGSHFIKEGTAVVVPPYTLFRDPAYFSPNPDTFWPERWLHSSASKRTPAQAQAQATARVGGGVSTYEKSSNSDAEVVTNTAAFIPFSYGPANCAGRNLALVEMRMVVALLVQRFEMRFAHGYDPMRWEEETEDYFVLKNGKLPVVLTPRA